MAGATRNLHRLIAESQKETPIEESFLEDLKRSVQLEVEKSTYKPSVSYKPSSLTCIRNMYFQMVEAPMDSTKPKTAALTRIGECGTDSHERIQRHIIKMQSNGIDCKYLDVKKYIEYKNLNYLKVLNSDTVVDDESEDPSESNGESRLETKVLDTRYNLRFKCDGLIQYKGKIFILEIKTESTNKFMMRDGVASEHNSQAACYSLSFGIDDVMFLYEGRDFCDWKCYLFHVTPEIREEYVIKKIQTCDSYVTNKQVPPLPIDAGRKLCKYCKYTTICKTAKD